MSQYALASVCANIWWGVKVEVRNESLSVLRRALSQQLRIRSRRRIRWQYYHHLSLNLDQEVYVFYLWATKDVQEHLVDPWLRPALSVIVVTPVKLCIHSVYAVCSDDDSFASQGLFWNNVSLIEDSSSQKQIFVRWLKWRLADWERLTDLISCFLLTFKMLRLT